jgi:hypothetical protein
MTANTSKSTATDRQQALNEKQDQLVAAKKAKRTAILQSLPPSKRAQQRRLFVIEDSIVVVSAVAIPILVGSFLINSTIHLVSSVFKPDTSMLPAPTSCVDARVAVKSAMGMNNVDKSRVSEDVFKASMAKLTSAECR